MSGRYDISYGDRYEATEDMDIVDLGKLIKKGIKEMMSDGAIPEMKVSVTTNRSPREVNVKFKSFPEDKPLFEEKSDDDPRGIHSRGPDYKMVDEAKEAKDRVEGFIESFNYDGSDIQTDYFNVRFYQSVKFHYELRSERLDKDLDLDNGGRK